MADVDQETIIDTLTEVYKEQRSKGESEEPEEATEPEDSEPDQEAEAEDFDSEVSEGAEDEDVEVEAQDDQEDEEPEQVFQAPEHWSSDYKAKFENLTNEARNLVLEFEKDFKNGYQERVRKISDVENALEPWRQHIIQRGMSEGDAIRTLFALQSQVERDPVNGVLSIAQRFGIMDQLRQQFAPDTDDEFVDPELKALRQQVQELHSQLGNFQQQTVQSQQETLMQQIESFKSQTDDSGNLVHPYFDQVRHTMAPLVSQGKTMEEAYNEAVWMVPEYRDQHIKTVTRKRRNESDVERAERVKQAKKAATANKQSGKAAAESSEPLSVADTLRVAWNDLS
jgi:hypothetical protein